MAKSPDGESPTANIVYGILMIVGAIWLFMETSLATAASLRQNAVLMTLYNIGGELFANCVIGVIGAIGIATLVMGIRKKRKE